MVRDVVKRQPDQRSCVALILGHCPIVLALLYPQLCVLRCILDNTWTQPLAYRFCRL